MTRMLGLVSCVVLTACGPKTPPAPPAPPPLDPAGNFEFITDTQGTAVSGSIEIRKAEGGGHSGWVYTSVSDPLPIGSVTVEGKRLTLQGDTADGPLTLVLTFEGDAFTGTWTYAGMSGVMSGKRVGG